MINLGVCCRDYSQMIVLKRYIKSFFYLNNFRTKLLGSIVEFNTLKDYMHNNDNIDVLFYYTSLPSKEYIFELSQKLTSTNPNIHIIFILDFVDFAINGFYLSGFDYLLLPLDYSFFKLEMSNYISKLDINTSYKDSKSSRYEEILRNKFSNILGIDIDN